MGARDDRRATVVGPHVGQVGQRLDEQAVEVVVLHVGAPAVAGTRVEAEGDDAPALPGRQVGVGIAPVDDGLGLFQPHGAADDLLHERDEPGMGRVL
jgi:hypothetical protein